MPADIEFQTFYKNAVTENSEILTIWINGQDAFKKTLAEFILTNGGTNNARRC